jgi:probable addiction module antidote protein
MESAMKKKYTRFDAADYLNSEKDIQAFLEASFDGGDQEHITRALGAIARARGMSKIARKTGISREGLYKALSGEGNPEFATILSVIHALGYKLAVAK